MNVFKYPDNLPSGSKSVDGIIVIATLNGDHYDVVANISGSFIENVMDKHWRRVAKTIKIKGFRDGRTPKYMVERVTGGRIELYSTLFCTITNEKIQECSPRKVIMLHEHVVREVDNGSWSVEAKLLLEPEIVVHGDIDHIKVPMVKLPNVDDYVDFRLQSFAKMNPYLRHKEDDKGNTSPAEPGNIVEVAVEASVDNVRYIPGCEASTNIILIREAIEPVELYDTLIGKNEGDFFVIETQNVGKFTDIQGRTLRLEVQVKRVYVGSPPEINNDLAITAGYDDLAKWKEYLKDVAHKSHERMLKTHKSDAVLTSLFNKIKINEFPDVWVHTKVNELVASGHYKVDNGNLQKLFEEVKRVAKQYVLLKYMGEHLKVEWEDANKSIYERNDDIYCSKVLNLLVSGAEFEDANHEPTKSDTGNQTGSASAQTT